MGEIRGLLARLITGVVVVGTTVGAIDQTIFRESFSTIPIDRAIDSRLDAYVPHAQRLKPMLRNRQTTAEEFRAEADLWISEAERNQLKPLAATYHGEILDGTPKGQMIGLTLLFAQHLNRLAEEEIQAGRIEAGVADSIRAFVVLDSIRFTSYLTMVQVSSCSRKAMHLTQENLAKTTKLPALLSRQLNRANHAEVCYQEFLKRAAHQKKIYAVRYGSEDAESVDSSDATRHVRIAAQRFTMVDQYAQVQTQAKMCRFAPDDSQSDSKK